jgi:hypothetical protein
MGVGRERALRLGWERCHEDGMRKGPWGWEVGGGEGPNCLRWKEIFLLELETKMEGSRS